MRKKTTGVIAGIVIIVAIASAVYLYQQKQDSDDIKSHWVVSGPFAIDKPRYKLAESVFISVHGLKPDEAGDIVFLTPQKIAYTAIPFNGTLKSDFNYYFKPDTSVAKKIYKPEDLVGTWEVVFQGVKYSSLNFDIINEFIIGGEKEILPININKTETVGPSQK